MAGNNRSDGYNPLPGPSGLTTNTPVARPNGVPRPNAVPSSTGRPRFRIGPGRGLGERKAPPPPNKLQEISNVQPHRAVPHNVIMQNRMYAAQQFRQQMPFRNGAYYPPTANNHPTNTMFSTPTFNRPLQQVKANTAPDVTHAKSPLMMALESSPPTAQQPPPKAPEPTTERVWPPDKDCPVEDQILQCISLFKASLRNAYWKPNLFQNGTYGVVRNIISAFIFGNTPINIFSNHMLATTCASEIMVNRCAPLFHSVIDVMRARARSGELNMEAIFVDSQRSPTPTSSTSNNSSQASLRSQDSVEPSDHRIEVAPAVQRHEVANVYDATAEPANNRAEMAAAPVVQQPEVPPAPLRRVFVIGPTRRPEVPNVPVVGLEASSTVIGRRLDVPPADINPRIAVPMTEVPGAGSVPDPNRYMFANRDVILSKIHRKLSQAASIDNDAVGLISDTVEETLRKMTSDICRLAAHRLIPFRMLDDYETVDDTKGQLKYIEMIDRSHSEARCIAESSQSVPKKKRLKPTFSSSLTEPRNLIQPVNLSLTDQTALNALEKPKPASNNTTAVKLPSSNVRPRTTRVNMRDLQTHLSSSKLPFKSHIVQRILLGFEDFSTNT